MKRTLAFLLAVIMLIPLSACDKSHYGEQGEAESSAASGAEASNGVSDESSSSDDASNENISIEDTASDDISSDDASSENTSNGDVSDDDTSNGNTSVDDTKEPESKAYGIQFNINDKSLSCKRIGAAVGKSVKSKDFDSIYPWSDMKLCNVRITNGRKTVVYENERSFSRSGANGNVMVEIPAFYVRRERIGTTEKWLISGEKAEGFELHPWFRKSDGTIAKYRYYGAYKASIDMCGKGVFSHSGGSPFMYSENDMKMWYVSDFSELISNHGYSRNTIYATSALQFLFCIEYATLNSQSVMNGVTYCPYFSGSNDYFKIENTGEKTNTFMLKKHSARFGNSFTLLGKGMQVCVDTAKNKLANKRNIVSVKSDNAYVYVTVDGAPITVTENTYCFPVPQDNGSTDGLMYHTGALTSVNAKVAPFKYRNIENLWGNLWEALDGIRIVNGKYYLSDKDDSGNWTALSFGAPMVTATDAMLTNRIVRMGIDKKHSALCLPDLLSKKLPEDITYTKMAGMYFGGDAYYSADKMPGETVFMPFFGGGYDHHENAGLFCMRFLNVDESKGWLYGERITC